MRFRLVVDGDSHDVDVETGPRGLQVRVDDAAYTVVAKPAQDTVVVRIGRRLYRIRVHGDRAFVGEASHHFAIPEVADLDERPTRRVRDRARRAVDVRPPMPGRVVRILVRPGDRVKKGQTLVVLEAMKMQNEIPAPADARVTDVRVAEGESVTGDRVIAVLEIR